MLAIGFFMLALDQVLFLFFPACRSNKNLNKLRDYPFCYVVLIFLILNLFDWVCISLADRYNLAAWWYSLFSMFYWPLILLSLVLMILTMISWEVVQRYFPLHPRFRDLFQLR